ncbi:hypothetical protein SUSAZ_03850 [Sulfolobus acidocaldarius SUSAZ]|nr:hypothetical protein SUSAZ_03850 [Sulfolobus acidocaldarius SUSAZ]
MLVKVPQRVFETIISELKSKVYDYNDSIKDFGVYLKPYHLVYKNDRKYIYIGKYWYKLEKNKGKLRWIYLGREKPYPNMPDPPNIPDYTIVRNKDGEYIIDSKILDYIK